MRCLLAAFIFFTRLPFWRLGSVPSDSFKRIIPYWPLVGWLTAGCSAGVWIAASLVLPTGIALLLSMVARLLLTGCLHEDGLADFLDGFGGGTTRERILSIMKDSHIGTYGVIGLALYFLLYYQVLGNLPPTLAAAAILAGDPFSKGVSAMLVNRLPYARNAETSKGGAVYSRMSVRDWIVCLLFAVLPLFLWLRPVYLLAAVFPVITWFFLTFLMSKKIQGYTGDCCGATFLLCELSFHSGVLILYTAQTRL
jgi:adenosylcobinamide-GDP ribazoletransferase